jgi:hypothetical protein
MNVFAACAYGASAVCSKLTTYGFGAQFSGEDENRPAVNHVAVCFASE